MAWYLTWYLTCHLALPMPEHPVQGNPLCTGNRCAINVAPYTGKAATSPLARLPREQQVSTLTTMRDSPTPDSINPKQPIPAPELKGNLVDSLIRGSSVMATLIRSHEWARSPLGPIEKWPGALLTSVNLVLSSPVHMQLLWGPGFTVFYNDAFSVQLGGMHPDALGQSARVVWKDAWPLVEQRLFATRSTGAVTDERSARIPIERDGLLEDSYWDFSYSPIYELDGTIAGVLNISHEITKEVIAERKLRASEQRSEQVLRSIGDAVIVTDAEANITRMNRVAEELTGWLERDAQGQALSQVFHIVHADTRQIMENPAAKVQRLGTIVGLANHTILLRKDGREIHIDDSGAPIQDTDGKFTGIVLVFRDVTAQRDSEVQLRAAQDHLIRSEADLKLITNALPAYISYVDTNLRYTRANRAYERLVGIKVSDLIGKRIDEVLDPIAVITVRQHLLKALAGIPQSFTYRLAAYEGERVLSVSHIPDLDANGIARGVVIEAHDITEQKRAEEMLLRSQERFRILIERSSFGVAIGNTRGNLTYLNPALLGLLDYTEEEVASGKVRWDRLTPPQFKDADQRAIEQLETSGVVVPYEKAYLSREGRAIPLLIGAAVIPSEAGADHDTDIAVFATDLTTQKRAEAVLLQTEKLAAVGKLASSISHEINNPLEAVTNLLYIARLDQSLTLKTREILDLADRELARVAQVASQTLRFHRQSTAPMTIQPEALVEDVLRLYSPRFANAGIRITRTYRLGAQVTCYEGEIRQVLSNLIGNALDAMRAGGTLFVRTRNAINWSTGEGGVRITVADTGSGMSPETLAHMFEAFYTTKEINGTGLGLWISLRIVQKHRGLLGAYSSTRASRHGAVFALWLPAKLAESAHQAWHLEEDEIGQT